MIESMISRRKGPCSAIKAARGFTSSHCWSGKKKEGEAGRKGGSRDIREEERAGRVGLSCCWRGGEEEVSQNVEWEAIPARRCKHNSIPPSCPLSLHSLCTRQPTNHLPDAYARATMILSKVASGSSPNRSAIFSIRSGRKLPSVSK